MATTTTIRVYNETQVKIKNFSTSNALSMLDATEKIVDYIVANGFTVSDLKKLNKESSFDRFYKRIDDVISLLRAVERDTMKPMMKEIRSIDTNVDTILSNMQYVQDYENLQEDKPINIDQQDEERLEQSNDLKYFVDKAEKAIELKDKLSTLFTKLESRTEKVGNEKRYILNEEIEDLIKEVRKISNSI